MGYRIDSSIVVHGPADVVWDRLQDLGHRLAWDARIRAIELLTPGPVGRGSRTRLTYGMLGVRTFVEIELVTFQPSRRSGVRGTMLATGDAIAGSWQLAPAGPGATRWTSTLVLTGRGRFGWLRERIAGPVLAWLTRRSQQNLKRLVEGAAPGPVGVPVAEAGGRDLLLESAA